MGFAWDPIGDPISRGEQISHNTSSEFYIVENAEEYHDLACFTELLWCLNMQFKRLSALDLIACLLKCLFRALLYIIWSLDYAWLKLITGG